MWTVAPKTQRIPYPATESRVGVGFSCRNPPGLRACRGERAGASYTLAEALAGVPARSDPSRFAAKVHTAEAGTGMPARSDPDRFAARSGKADGGTGVAYFVLPGHNFGLKSAPVAFNRAAACMSLCSNRLLGICCGHYYDDFLTLEPQ